MRPLHPLALTLPILALPACSGVADALTGATPQADSADAPADLPPTDSPPADLLTDPRPDAPRPDVPAWTSDFEPDLAQAGGIFVLRLKGTPFDMGVQHATLMKEQLLQGVAYIESSYLAALEAIARSTGYMDEAKSQSYPATIDECQGMASVLADQGWTFERCLALAYGEVILDGMSAEGTGCSQFVATGSATANGSMLHGRNLDWDKIDYLLDYPTLIVRHPEGGIPYVAFGFPGNTAPYTGMNAAGLTIASNEARPSTDFDRQGRPHIQMIAQMLAHCESVDQARAFLESQDHMSAEIFVLSDGSTAAVAELTASHLGFRPLSQAGTLLATNHFIIPEMVPYNAAPDPGSSTLSRYARLEELLGTNGQGTAHGSLDPDGAVAILRDGYNPVTGLDVPPSQFDGGGTIANNGAIYTVLCLPAARILYVAGGPIPVPQNPLQGFSLPVLLGLPGATSPQPPSLP